MALTLFSLSLLRCLYGHTQRHVSGSCLCVCPHLGSHLRTGTLTIIQLGFSFQRDKGDFYNAQQSREALGGWGAGGAGGGGGGGTLGDGVSRAEGGEEAEAIDPWERKVAAPCRGRNRAIKQ